MESTKVELKEVTDLQNKDNNVFVAFRVVKLEGVK